MIICVGTGTREKSNVKRETEETGNGKRARGNGKRDTGYRNQLSAKRETGWRERSYAWEPGSGGLTGMLPVTDSHFPTTLRKRTSPHPPPRKKKHTHVPHPPHPHYNHGPVLLNRVGGMSHKALKLQKYFKKEEHPRCVF